MPVAMTPIRALTMNRPARVSSSIVMRNDQPPESPATVPGSRACIRLLKSCLKNPGLLPSSFSGAHCVIRMKTVNTRISTSVTTASHMTSADVPRAIVPSNQ